MTCNPITIHRAGQYQAWCRPHGWESDPYPFRWQALRAAEQHREGGL